MRQRRAGGHLLLILATLTLLSGQAAGQSLPPSLNLGYTTFKDGGVPAGAGLYGFTYLRQAHSDKFVDSNGNDILPNAELDSTVVLQEFLWIWDRDLGIGAKPGLDLVIPMASIDLDHGTGGRPFNDGGGITDILIGPVLQFDMITRKSGAPLFLHRMEAQIYIPVGEYSSFNDVNLGQNQWFFDPYWSMTWFITPRLHASARPHYLWNGTNDNPPISLGANKIKVGQAFHTNFAIGYDVMPALTLGVSGYWLKQTTDTKFDGVEIKGRREEVFAIGPSLAFVTKKDASQFFGTSLYFESEGENRFEGWNVHFQYMIKWRNAEDLCVPKWRKQRKSRRSVPCDAYCGHCG